VVQIVGLIAHPEAKGVGSLLRNFLLQLAKVEAGVQSVVGITRCDGWRAASGESMEDYVERHRLGELADKILGFHTSYGASVVRALPGARPADSANAGAGVLIRYAPKARRASPVAVPAERRTGAAAEVAAADVEHELLGCLRSLGAEVHETAKPQEVRFSELELDSLDLMRIRTHLTQIFGVDLPLTALFDNPSVAALAQAAVVELAAQVAEASGKSAARASPELLRSVLAELGFDASDAQGGSGGDGGDFAALGMDSIDLARLRERLAETLGTALPSTVCLEFPSVAALADRLGL